MEAVSEAKVEGGASGAIEKLVAALAKAQGVFEQPKNIKRGQQGHRTFKYAPLPEVYRAIRPGLSANELADVSFWEEIGGKLYMTTELRHSGGGVLVSRWPVSNTPDSQERGKEGTYGRRNNICALTGVVGEELDADDGDGESDQEAEESARREAAKRQEAEKRLDALKGKGQVRSAHDGKVLAPGEPALPAERGTRNAERGTGDGGRLTVDGGRGEETVDRRPQTADRNSRKAAGPTERGLRNAERGTEDGGRLTVDGGRGEETADRRPKTADRNSGKAAGPAADRKEEGGGQGTGRPTPTIDPKATPAGGADKDGLAHSAGSTSSPQAGSTGSPQAGSGLAGIAKPLADLMRRDGITSEMLKRYYVGKRHLPDSVAPTALPADYVVGLTKPENWKLAVKGMKGGK